MGLTDAYNSAEVTTLGTALAKFVHNNCDGSSCQTMNSERHPDFTNEKLWRGEKKKHVLETNTLDLLHCNSYAFPP